VRALSMPGNDAGDRQVLTVITDITEMKLLELEALRGKKLEGITQAAVTLNHEINNPLGVILGNANLLMTDCPDENAEQHEKLNIIFQQTKRISEITQKLAKITQPYEAQYLDDKMMIDVNRST
jgi:two-component system NtrC family sensor kinase